MSLIILGVSGLQAQELHKPNTTPAVELLLLSEESEKVEPNIVFVTSTTYDGNLGGLAGADQKCQDCAEAAGLPKILTKRGFLPLP